MTRLFTAALGLALLAGCPAGPTSAPSEAPEAEAEAAPPVVVEHEDQPEQLDPEEASKKLLAAAARNDMEAVRRYAEVVGVRLGIRRRSEYTGDHDTHGYTPLSFAAYHANGEMFEYLISRGASPGIGSLYAGARGGDVEIFTRLLTLLEPEADDITGALVMACANKSRELIELLLARGANLDGVGWGGNEYDTTCLGEAVMLGDLAWVEHVLSLGADVNQPDDADYTPLMLAASGEYNPEEAYDDEERKEIEAELAAAISIVERLLEAGADPHHRSEQSEETALDLAQEGSVIEARIRRALSGKGKAKKSKAGAGSSLGL